MKPNDYGLNKKQVAAICDLWETFCDDLEAVVDIALWDSIPGLTELDSWVTDLQGDGDTQPIDVE